VLALSSWCCTLMGMEDKSNKGKTVRLKGPNGTVRVVSADYWAGCTPLNALAEKVKSLHTSNLDASNKSETKCK
jgi:hypothetical protein